MTAACRERAYPQLTTKLQHAVRQQQQAAPSACGRSALFYGYLLLSETAINHPTTPLPLLLAVCDRIIQRHRQCDSDNRQQQQQESVLTPS